MPGKLTNTSDLDRIHTRYVSFILQKAATLSMSKGMLNRVSPQKPLVASKGRKFEKARGRRRSRGFKV